MTFIGEHLWIGTLGHALVLISFVSALLGIISYYRAGRQESNSWQKLGTLSFVTHSISLFSLIGLIFYMMYHRYFEYSYVFEHVSNDLPMKYILSAFWEGQEGSFMLWAFWHAILGIVILRNTNEWTNGVLMVLLTIQAFLLSMILGLYIPGMEGTKIGSSPFTLLRHTIEAPIFSNPNYLDFVEGSGLNALLQNYWMTIHPPTLFLGFASTSIPFAYVIAGLWQRKMKESLRAVLRWSLFSAFIFGLGILMGGAWAYEALSFGGYWAWDPVENMSLVPWLLLIAAVHTNLISNATKRSTRLAVILYSLTFIGVLYSTFLTRSGVLGDTSVHAFTEMGLEWQLILFMLFYVLLAAYLLISRNKSFASIASEESLLSREFWMYIGALVLIFSSVLITFTTSIPVYNKIFDGIGLLLGTDMTSWHRSSPLDAEAHYNRYQLWIAVLIGLLSGVAQYLRYNERNWNQHKHVIFKHIGISLLLSATLFIFISNLLQIYHWSYFVLLFAGLFAILSNGSYWIFKTHANPRLLASSLSHVGFGIMILGIMASGLNKRHISKNPMVMSTLQHIMDEENLQKNVLLVKDAPLHMSGYEVTYKGDSLEQRTHFFNVNYKKLNDEGEIQDEFDLSPNVLYSKDFTKVESSNPSTKRYINKDVFTLISWLPPSKYNPEHLQMMEDSLDYQTAHIGLQDTFSSDMFRYIIDHISLNPKSSEYQKVEGDLAIGLTIKAEEIESGNQFELKPFMVIRDRLVYHFPDENTQFGVKAKLPEELINEVFDDHQSVTEDIINLGIGESTKWQKYEVKLLNYNREANDSPGYIPKEGDIAVNAIVELVSNDKSAVIRPLFLIRDNKTVYIKDYDAMNGIFSRFTTLDPKSGKATLELSRVDISDQQYSFRLAENLKSTDYIVLEAIVFPGINLFWLGTLMMLLGFLLGLFLRRKHQ